METLTEITEAELARRERAYVYERLKDAEYRALETIKRLQRSPAEAESCSAVLRSIAEQVRDVPTDLVTKGHLGLPGGMNLHYVLGLLVDDALAEIQRKQDDITAQLTKARTALAEVRAALKDFS